MSAAFQCTRVSEPAIWFFASTSDIIYDLAMYGQWITPDLIQGTWKSKTTRPTNLVLLVHLYSMSSTFYNGKLELSIQTVCSGSVIPCLQISLIAIKYMLCAYDISRCWKDCYAKPATLDLRTRMNHLRGFNLTSFVKVNSQNHVPKSCFVVKWITNCRTYVGLSISSATTFS